MLDLAEFVSRWRAFVSRWAAASEDERSRLVQDAMDHGLPDGEPGEAPDRDAVLAAEVAVIRASGEFDEFGYMWHNPDLRWHLCTGPEQAIHFAERGWHEMRHPSPGFDLWHYTNAYLDPEDDEVNPVVHYALEGRRHGLDTLPQVRELPAPTAPTGAPRRVCLFAAFDVDGIVDPTVVSYLADLSRFADVYYLADCELEDGELDKLAPYTKGAWAVRHGRYDFGSYSMLATDLVGWDVIDQYDEMMLANDSCWLVQPLDTVFAKMDATACDWWGLQATYEDFGVKEHEALGRPLSLDDVEEQMRQQDLWRYSDFIHVGSYFLVYRRRVLDDPEFRRRLETVAKQRDKTAIILKYEIGFSRLLILGGYHLATFVDGILPYHPVYRASAFDVMADGFPLLKRQFLYENPFSAPDLRLWKQRVLEHVPDADVDAMESNLRRIAPAWSLHRSFAIRSGPDGTAVLPEPLGSETFPDEDRWVPSFDHWWGFPVDPRTGLLSGAVRAVFDAVRDDPSVKKIVLEGSRPLDVSGQNVVRIATESPPGQMYGLRMGTILTTVGPRSDVNHPLSPRYHRFLQLGRPTGLSSPDVGLDGSGDTWGLRDASAVELDDSLTRAVVVSGARGAEAAARLARLDPDGVWELGSPRIDLLVTGEAALAPAHRAEIDRLRTVLAGRRLVVVEPWGGSVDLDVLAAWAVAHPEVAVGVRPRTGGGGSLPEPLLDLSDESLISEDARTLFPVHPETAWRCADVLVSGSVADLADWAVLGRPAISLVATDEALAAGLPLPKTARDDLGAALDTALGGRAVEEAYADWGRALHAASDGHAAERVVRAIKRTYLPIDEWEAEEAAVDAATGTGPAVSLS
ncbi:rhamnan synthesis F family protein [Nocardioides sp. zg-1228]|uniref:rhamnan synthesis F family protein n=1 Tax=Nocardioides sp. zg-1228 TaxID=2763008 RepID=UPI001F11E081|nr:rhamnan synthesis F family protein [Nocardioides sp. zg-1228]